eukprot:GEMP01068874.1.p2 GENE.GEMP01068874.1~~GEMP01068874.1.p2  ORF type:complete len:141 (+),score=34.50 GEMP01068874.1:94-516(+)
MAAAHESTSSAVDNRREQAERRRQKILERRRGPEDRESLTTETPPAADIASNVALRQRRGPHEGTGDDDVGARIVDNTSPSAARAVEAETQAREENPILNAMKIGHKEADVQRSAFSLVFANRHAWRIAIVAFATVVVIT